jgi:hypothetical protein
VGHELLSVRTTEAIKEVLTVFFFTTRFLRFPSVSSGGWDVFLIARPLIADEIPSSSIISI